VGGLTLDQAVTNAFLEALTPAALEVTALAVQQLESNHDAALSQWRLEVERARYEAERAERQYKAVEPEHRLVVRGLEKALLSRIYGWWILVPGVVPSCDKGQFPSPRRCESHRIFW